MTPGCPCPLLQELVLGACPGSSLLAPCLSALASQPQGSLRGTTGGPSPSCLAQQCSHPWVRDTTVLRPGREDVFLHHQPELGDVLPFPLQFIILSADVSTSQESSREGLGEAELGAWHTQPALDAAECRVAACTGACDRGTGHLSLHRDADRVTWALNVQRKEHVPLQPGEIPPWSCTGPWQQRGV